VVGDFDSIDPDTAAKVRKMCPVRSFPVRKDKTDTHLALEMAREMEPVPREVVICGAFGDRVDHNLGLVLLLAGMETPPEVRLMGVRQEALTATGPARVPLAGSAGDTVSLLPLSPTVWGITTEGLSYPLERGTLTWGTTLGVSNEMTGPQASVAFEAGTLLVVHLRGAW